MDKKKIIKKACGKGGPADKIRGGIKGALNLSDKIAKVGKEKIVPAIKGAAKGAKDAYVNSIKSDKKNMGFADVGSYAVTAPLKAVAGGIAGGVKALKNTGQKSLKAMPVQPTSMPLKKAPAPIQNLAPKVEAMKAKQKDPGQGQMIKGIISRTPEEQVKFDKEYRKKLYLKDQVAKNSLENAKIKLNSKIR